jgi:hypothetical protein
VDDADRAAHCENSLAEQIHLAGKIAAPVRQDSALLHQNKSLRVQIIEPEFFRSASGCRVGIATYRGSSKNSSVTKRPAPPANSQAQDQFPFASTAAASCAVGPHAARFPARPLVMRPKPRRDMAEQFAKRVRFAFRRVALGDLFSCDSDRERRLAKRTGLAPELFDP